MIIVGDFNAKISNSDDGAVPASGNGEYLCEVLKKYQLSVVNFLSLCTGEWTWSREILGELHKSKLDFLITDSHTEKDITKMDIDENKTLCPFHREKVKGSEKLVYSDHNVITAEFSITYQNKKTEKNKEMDDNKQRTGTVWLENRKRLSH